MSQTKSDRLSPSTLESIKAYDELKEHAGFCDQCRAAIDSRSGNYCVTGDGLVKRFYNPEN